MHDPQNRLPDGSTRTAFYPDRRSAGRTADCRRIGASSTIWTTSATSAISGQTATIGRWLDARTDAIPSTPGKFIPSRAWVSQ